VRHEFEALFERSAKPISRSTYITAGVSLMLLKYAIDAAVIGAVGGVWWTPFDYLMPLISFNSPKLAALPQWLRIWLLVWALPFIWVGVFLSVRRAMDARISPGVVILFFIPGFNYVLMAALATVPSREPDEAPSILERFPEGREEESSRGLPTDGQLAIGAGAVAGLCAAAIGVVLLRSYGGSVFLGAPFAVGLISALVLNRRGRRTQSQAVVVGQLALLSAAGVVLLFAIEGAICLMMAVPVASPVTVIGSLVGHLLARGRGPSAFQHVAVLAGVLTLGTVADAAMPAPSEQMVLTAIEINAPPSTVWRHVTSFSDIAAAPAWYFRTGLAYPLRARIEGQGVGAVRHCEFSTGAFVEPITVWDEPRRLGFGVVSQPAPLVEWSPYTSVYAPHLDGFFKTSRGEFRLIDLGNGRTRLEGRTWYALDMQPAMYWGMVADTILHAIHKRVLEHIRAEAERGD
jgi:hypothetical protein